MAKFTKLNIGDAVASSGGRVWKKLSVESAEVQDELAGTWVLNSTPKHLAITSGSYQTFKLSGTFSSYEDVGSTNVSQFTFDRMTFYWDKDTRVISISMDYTVFPYNALNYSTNNGWMSEIGYKNANNITQHDQRKIGYDLIKEMKINTNLSEVTNGDALLTWLKANATKQTTESESVVGTWTFNDTLDIEDFTSNSYNVDFTSNNVEYGKFWVGFYSDSELDYVKYSSSDASWANATEVYRDNSWNNSAFKTIRITSEPTDTAFIEWLKANATKQ